MATQPRAHRRPGRPGVSAELRDITIVGAGPAGLAAAFWAGMRQASTRVVDALPEIGGQLTALYPEKPIYDVLGHQRILARELVTRLQLQALEPFDVPLHLDTTAHHIAWTPEGVVIDTTAGPLRSRAVIVAGGHGAVRPRRLPDGDADLTQWEGRGVAYVARSKAVFAGRRVVVVGGGDAALDWALDLLDVAAAVTLVHRRERFRAHEATVARAMAAVDAGRLALRVPWTVAGADGDGSLAGLTLRHRGDGTTERLPCDAVLLQLGHVTRLGPLADWGFAVDGGAIATDGLMGTSLDRVWACGDVTTAPGKLKLIATGFGEAAVAVGQAVHRLRPETQLQPAYSTDTGVPGT